jgi:hypothetical protein
MDGYGVIGAEDGRDAPERMFRRRRDLITTAPREANANLDPGR